MKIDNKKIAKANRDTLGKMLESEVGRIEMVASVMTKAGTPLITILEELYKENPEFGKQMLHATLMAFIGQFSKTTEEAKETIETLRERMNAMEDDMK